MIIQLKRFQYSKTETMGVLLLPTPLFTIERPWVSVKNHKGGKPFASCVPDGLYELLPFNSEKHPNTWALHQPVMDVYAEQDQVPETGGRYACLFHVANYVKNVEGCIGPGLSRVIMDNQNAVSSSGAAMSILREFIAARSEKQHFLEVSPYDGTGEEMRWLSHS